MQQTQFRKPPVPLVELNHNEKLPPLESMVNEVGDPRKKGEWRRIRKHPKPKTTGTLVCEHCGVQFPATPRQIKRCQRFCSGDCRFHLTQPERFWRKVDKSPNDKGCWIWNGARCANRYGNFVWNGVSQLAHRIAYEINSGTPVPPDKYVCHSCDNGFCVNPGHLFLGTQKENMQDMLSKGRKQTRVLSLADKLAIFHSSESRIALSEKYSVTPRTIADIQNLAGCYKNLKGYTSAREAETYLDGKTTT